MHAGPELLKKPFNKVIAVPAMQRETVVDEALVWDQNYPSGGSAQPGGGGAWGVHMA